MSLKDPIVRFFLFMAVVVLSNIAADILAFFVAVAGKVSYGAAWNFGAVLAIVSILVVTIVGYVGYKRQ